jgi:formylglycine-generating enzyme required for sulfatase activity
MLRIVGGTFLMGCSSEESCPADGEGPVHEVRVSTFWMDARATTNAEFARFVEATGYVTDAERFGWSFVFGGLLPDDFPETRAIRAAPWWRQVVGAAWRHPEGPHASIAERLDHPVVHVSWNDARAYAAWTGKRLPSEAEWEYAARGGLVQARFAWGDQLTPAGEHRCNIWQGSFPDHNTAEDGFVGTAPVASFPPNAFGLYDMAGNVWQWCADWFSPSYYQVSPVQDPGGPRAGGERVIRGGSYLCHASYCSRYRVAARSRNTPESSTGNLGFRCVKSEEAP